MDNIRKCAICGGQNGIENHHIVFRSQAPYATNIPHNQIDLCAVHHRGNYSPHKNREVDLMLKKRLQKKYENLFDRPYYSHLDIMQLLGMSTSAVSNIMKTVLIQNEGYEREDIIRRLMGGRMY